MQHSSPQVLDTLQQDHALLRKKIALLSAALQVAPESRFVLRQMCFSLQRLLNDHTLREFQLLYSACREDLWQAVNHASTLTRLRGVNELLLVGWRASLASVVVRLAQVIEQLETQIAEQERAVFPQIGPLPTVDAGRREAALSGTMSVNEILQRYPQTQRCFDELHVNRLQEGYESVDELAWHHGLNVGELLEQLQHTLSDSHGP